FYFACECLKWLTDDGRRKRVCFVEDGRVVTNFNITLKEPEVPPIPMPSEGELIEKGNEILAGLDEGDTINRLINRVPHQNLLRLALVLLTGGLCMWGLWRLTQNRHRLDRLEPVLAVCLAGQGARRTLLDQRNEALLRQNNYWEAAHQLARQWFASVLEAPGARMSSAEWRFAVPPKIVAQGSWWQRRRLRRQVLRLWRVAAGHGPEHLSGGGLRRLEAELRAVRAALALGTLQLSES